MNAKRILSTLQLSFTNKNGRTEVYDLASILRKFAQGTNVLYRPFVEFLAASANLTFETVSSVAYANGYEIVDKDPTEDMPPMGRDDKFTLQQDAILVAKVRDDGIHYTWEQKNNAITTVFRQYQRDIEMETRHSGAKNCGSYDKQDVTSEIRIILMETLTNHYNVLKGISLNTTFQRQVKFRLADKFRSDEWIDHRGHSRYQQEIERLINEMKRNGEEIDVEEIADATHRSVEFVKEFLREGGKTAAQLSLDEILEERPDDDDREYRGHSDDVTNAISTGSAEGAAIRKTIRKQIRDGVENWAFTDRERLLLKLWSGMDDGVPMSTKECAEALDVSLTTASRILKSALERLEYGLYLLGYTKEEIDELF